MALLTKKMTSKCFLCYIIKYSIDFFNQLVFFQLAEVLYFFLERMDRWPCWSELEHHSFWVHIAKTVLFTQAQINPKKYQTCAN